MLRLLKVSGDSLSPGYQDGDFVLVIKIPILLSLLKPGDIVVFKHPLYGTMIKKIDHLTSEPKQIFVIGTHQNSVDSRQFGAVDPRVIVGKVIWHIKKQRRS